MLTPCFELGDEQGFVEQFLPLCGPDQATVHAGMRILGQRVPLSPGVSSCVPVSRLGCSAFPRGPWFFPRWRTPSRF